MTINRCAHMFTWRFATIQSRADWARRNILRYMSEYRAQRQDDTGLAMYSEMPSYVTEAIDQFVDLAIEQERDDEDAAEAASDLSGAVDGWVRGAFPDMFLYHGALGPLVRARLLKDGWTTGRAGSALCLWRPGRDVLCEYFAETEEQFLMDDEERAEVARLRHIGQPITIYRGARMRPQGLRATGYAMSWTRDVDMARRFATNIGRGDGAPVVLQAQYDPAHILALWETSGREPEVVVNPRRLRSISVLEQPAMRLAA
jgi:hypothetical protein